MLPVRTFLCGDIILNIGRGSGIGQGVERIPSRKHQHVPTSLLLGCGSAQRALLRKPRGLLLVHRVLTQPFLGPLHLHRAVECKQKAAKRRPAFPACAPFAEAPLEDTYPVGTHAAAEARSPRPGAPAVDLV